jgi:hypothetical protein
VSPSRYKGAQYHRQLTLTTGSPKVSRRTKGRPGGRPLVRNLLVEQRGIEPLTSALRTRRSAKLSYCPDASEILETRRAGVKRAPCATRARRLRKSIRCRLRESSALPSV